MTPKEREQHFNRVAEIPCLSCCAHPVTLHHPHGGSMVDEGITTGMGLKCSDWLVLPICEVCHQGPKGYDSSYGVRSAELIHGKQTDHIRTLSKILKLELLSLAKGDKKPRTALTSSKILARAS